MRRILSVWVWVSVLVFGLGSVGVPLATAQDNAPTLATCTAWLRENQQPPSTSFADHGCQEESQLTALDMAFGAGAGVVPVGDERFAIAWFPPTWEQQSDQRLIFSLHGSGGCAERLSSWWLRASKGRGYAVVALQYAQLGADGEYVFDESEEVYAHLLSAYETIGEHCPIEDATVILHGFSRGSEEIYHQAALDYSEDGEHLFAAFVADSGAGFVLSEGRDPAFIHDGDPDLFGGAHFWLYCGGHDHEGRTCEGMERMQPLLEAHGAVVDALYTYPEGGHGILPTFNNGRPSRALRDFFTYLDNVGATPTP